jgi:hypothetical protein
LCTICGKELKKDYQIKICCKFFQILHWQGFQSTLRETRYSIAFQRIDVSSASDIYVGLFPLSLAHRGLERALFVA